MKSVKRLCIIVTALVTLAVSVAMAAERPDTGLEQFRSQEMPKASSASNGAVEARSTAFARTVSGHRIGHYKDGLVPVDLSISVVAAFVPNGGGGYDEIVGTGTSMGTFSIPDVPSGFYLLRLGEQYLWTKNTMVNADFYASKRSTALPPVNYTTLTFNLANLNAWQDTDFFELAGPSTGAFDEYPGVAGETTFTGVFQYSDYLNNSALGDKTYFLQLITQPVGGYAFTAAGRYFAPSNFVQVDGANTTVSGTLKAVNQNQTFRANINGADLAAQTLAANPGAVLLDTTLALDVYPGSLAKGVTTSTPDLVGYSLYTGANPITINADLGDVLYGDPFPPDWPLFATYQYSALTDYLAPGATNATAIVTDVAGFTTALPSQTSPIQPLVGTVTSPSVGGRDFFANQRGIGVTPTLSWAPPSVGTANAYAVFVYQLSNNAGNTEYVQIARLQTQSTSITIPPGLLSPLSTGAAYVFRVRTLYHPGVDVASKPYVSGPVNALADVISGVMQP
jgi:hypothetical protein